MTITERFLNITIGALFIMLVSSFIFGIVSGIQCVIESGNIFLGIWNILYYTFGAVFVIVILRIAATIFLWTCDLIRDKNSGSVLYKQNRY